MKIHSICFITVVMPVLLIGCCSQKEETKINKGIAFLSEFMSIRNYSFQNTIVEGALTKAISSEERSYISVRLPIDEFPERGGETFDLDAVKTLGDIERIVKEYGAVLEHVEGPVETDGLIPVSKAEIQTSLQPLVQHSKQYLYSLGMSESDISEMIAEADADESALIPLAAAMVESDMQYFAQAKASRFSLIPNAYALTWGDAGNCALYALGWDVAAALNRSSGRAFTKAAMKTALKAVAKRCVGYIGVAIFVVQFGACLGSRL